MDPTSTEVLFPKIGTRIRLYSGSHLPEVKEPFSIFHAETLLKQLSKIDQIFSSQFIQINIENLLLFSTKTNQQLGFILAYLFSKFKSIKLVLYEIVYAQNKPIACGQWEYDYTTLEVKLKRTFPIAIQDELVPDLMGQPLESIDLIRFLVQKNIFTPLIIEKKGFKTILSKFNLSMNDRGELYKYDTNLLKFFNPGTIFFPIDLNERVIHLFEIVPATDASQSLEFVLRFLRYLKTYIQNRFYLTFGIQSSKGYGIYEHLLKRESLRGTKYVLKGIIFFDIYEYSKLSLKIKIEDDNEELLERTKSILLYTFHYVVTRVVEQFHPLTIDKIVGDQVMVVMNPREDIDDPTKKEQELSERTFLLSWNISLALRFINRELERIFAKHNFKPDDDTAVRNLLKEYKNRSFRVNLVNYSSFDASVPNLYIDIPMDIAINYYYLLRIYDIKGGIECRTGLNVGHCLEIFLGGSRLDHTYIGKQVDLAARMESLSKRNAIKMPSRVYSLLSKDFREFIVQYFLKETEISNKELTYKMIFLAKREFPKGSLPIGTVEFSSNAVYFFKTAQDTYRTLEALFWDLDYKRLDLRIDQYIQNNQFDLIEKLRRIQPTIIYKAGEELMQQIKSTPSIRKIIEEVIVRDTENKIAMIIKNLQDDRETYRLVRNLVIGKDRNLYHRYFLDKTNVSVPRKRKYFTEELSKVFAAKINFELVSKEDIDNIIADLNRKIYGKTSN